ncbi:NUDIX domain-containing protein [Botrytis cinerea]
MPSPSLPPPAHPDVDSMLTRKFGREVANYFSGSPLNRVSFLRANHDFISSAFTHPATNFLLLNNLAPLTKDPSHLAYSSHSDITGLTGQNPFEKDEETMIKEFNSSKTSPLVLFLGLDERSKDKEGFKHGIYSGIPYFAIDVTPKGTYENEANSVVKAMQEKGLVFQEGRMLMSLDAQEAAIFAQARALLDWNARNPFCGGCGQPTLSVSQRRYQTRLSPTDFASLPTAQAGTNPATPTQRASCATRKGVSNLCFPRTDPTVIMAVVSHDGKRVLLGRQKRWPQYWYSALAGFCEPAESVEEAVRREVWEESGVKLGRVVIHSTQPWPYPANLMIGAIAQALPDGEKIHLEHDPELEDAKWFEMEEIREALLNGTSPLGEPASEGYKEGNLRLPSFTAIATQLIKAVADGFLGESPKI